MRRRVRQRSLRILLVVTRRMRPRGRSQFSPSAHDRCARTRRDGREIDPPRRASRRDDFTRGGEGSENSKTGDARNASILHTIPARPSCGAVVARRRARRYSVGRSRAPWTSPVRYSSPARRPRSPHARFEGRLRRRSREGARFASARPRPRARNGTRSWTATPRAHAPIVARRPAAFSPPRASPSRTSPSAPRRVEWAPPPRARTSTPRSPRRPSLPEVALTVSRPDLSRPPIPPRRAITCTRPSASPKASRAPTCSRTRSVRNPWRSSSGTSARDFAATP